MPNNEQKTTIEVPPDTLQDVGNALCLKTRFSYMVMGTKDLRAWKVAMALRNDFPDFLIIRIENRDDAKQWLGDKDAAAIFFSNCGIPMRLLTQSEAEDRTTTRKIVKEVKEKGCPG